MLVPAIALAEQFAYIKIPADTIRGFCDDLFPSLAKNLNADVVSGAYHRYNAGHDLLLDVFNTYNEQGLTEASKQFGHILLTDFPTKAGIPIPGFSQSGLGQFLTNLGITKGWLSLNLGDAFVGILAVAEGHRDLLEAITGELQMEIPTFFDTFVEGGVEIGISIATKNPLMLGSGIENILAGIVSTYNTFRYYVDPIKFWGSGVTSCVIGFTVSRFILKQGIAQSLLNSSKSGMIGCLFAVNPLFAYGAIMGCAAWDIGEKFAQKQNQALDNYLFVDNKSLLQWFNELLNIDPNFSVEYKKLLKLSKQEQQELADNVFKEFSAYYDEDLPTVLKDLSKIFGNFGNNDVFDDQYDIYQPFADEIAELKNENATEIKKNFSGFEDFKAPNN